MKKTKNVFMATILIICFITLLNCSDKQETANAISEKVFTFGYRAEMVSLDPPGQSDTPSTLVLKQIYSTLFQINEQLEVVADLCDSYRMIDELTWEFVIKKGVMFHNGTELTAEDVAFALNRAFNESTSRGTFPFCETVTVIDSHTVRLSTERPYAPLLNKLAHAHGSVYPKTYFDEVGADGLAQKPVGSGPFIFSERITGDRVILTAFDNYHNGRPNIDKAIIRVIPEASAMTIALETGEIDATRELIANDIEKIKANPDLTVEIVEAASLIYLGFNTRKEPFADPALRRALSYAINRDDIVAVTTEGYGYPAKGFLPNQTIGAQEFAECEYNPEKAKELLTAAGYDNLSFMLTITDTKSSRDMAIIVQSNLAEIGVSMDMEVIEWASYLNKLKTGEHEAFVLGYVSDGEPDATVYRLWHSTDFEAGETGSNFTLLNDTQLDRLLEQGATTFGNQAREPIYNAINRRLIELMPALPGWWRSTNLCYNNRVKNMQAHPAGTYIFDRLDID